MAVMEKAYLGGGCFWCTEASFQNLKGVSSVVSGYMGGSIKNPCYREICTGNTGHAEVIEIDFDPEVISFETLLEIFWTVHDPTTLNQQGADKGTQYRSVVFYTSEMQREKTMESIKDVASTLWENPIVTEVSPVEVFYKAEENHQNYFNNNGFKGYCRIVIEPKVSKVRQKFKHLLKQD